MCIGCGEKKSSEKTEKKNQRSKKKVMDEIVAEQMGWPGRLYQTYQAYKTNAELKESKDPNWDSVWKCGILASIAGAAILATNYVTTAQTKKYVLKDEADAIYKDPTLLEHLYELQTFRDLQPEMFADIIENINSVVFLEMSMRSGKVAPRPSDRITAYDQFRLAYNDLMKFKLLVKQDMDPEYAVAAHVLIEKIQHQLQIYYRNILIMTQDFNLKNTMKRAPHDVARVTKRLGMSNR